MIYFFLAKLLYELSNSILPTNNWHKLVNGLFNHHIPKDIENVLIVSGPIYNFPHHCKEDGYCGILRHTKEIFPDPVIDNNRLNWLPRTGEKLKFYKRYERRLDREKPSPVIIYTLVFKDLLEEKSLIVAIASINRETDSWYYVDATRTEICKQTDEGELKIKTDGACETTLDKIKKIAAYPSEDAFGFINHNFFNKNIITAVGPPLKQGIRKKLKEDAKKMIEKFKLPFFKSPKKVYDDKRAPL